ncbi:MAG: adenylosuccinate lyase [Alphaproteobacteria bacterium]|nr:adenylosuccinate lyase [Alphaproteobacteria bacterium]
MIPRYSRPEMTAIWAPENRFKLWLEVEISVLEAMAEGGYAPPASAKAVREKATACLEQIIDPARIDAIEEVTRHDVIAFLTHVEEVIGEEARFLHLGMTSSDLLDTTFGLQLAQASDILLADLDRLLAALKTRAFEHKDTLCMGRSHGIHAEPITFGLKLAGFYAEFSRNRERLVAARREIATCAVSGAVGTFAHIDPEIEAKVASRLGLEPETISTQVIPRDRHAMYFSTLGVIASSIERLATEIRHLQRTEVAEAGEAFGKGQKGSSAMPHKRNPILTENLTGLARIVRSAVVPALENVALWHERDISHSSVERMIGPDATVTLDFALHRSAGVVERLVVDPERMLANLEMTQGLVHSQQVLLKLTEAGLARQAAYAIVQRNAMRAWEEKRPLLPLLEAEPEVAAHLDRAELADLFDLAHHTRHVNTIFARIFDA